MRARTFIAPVLALALGMGCSDSQPTGPNTSVASLEGQPELASVATSHSTVTPFPTGAIIPGASAILQRHANGVKTWLTTSGLTKGNAYTLWVVVFNHPSECIVAGACSLMDVAANDPAVGVDLINGAGLVAGGSGKATFSGRVKVGELGDRGVGLLDAFEPTIHLVVRDHGPKLAGSAQLSTFGGGCDVNACANVQDAAAFQD